LTDEQIGSDIQSVSLRHFKAEISWYPELLHRGGAKAWGGSDQLTFEQRVNARTRELIESHQPEPLSDEIVEQIEDIIRRAEE